MVTVNNLCGVFEESRCNISVLLPHITYEVSNAFTAFGIPLFQVVNKLLLTSVGQNVKYALRCRVGDDTLIFDIAGIALKFIDSEYMRKLLGTREAQYIENPYNRGNREINGFGNRSERTLTSELINYMSNQAACHAVVSRDKGMLLGEAFAAMGTAISSASVIEDNCLPKSGNILDKPSAVVVNI